jgi:hypothetical protein
MAVLDPLQIPELIKRAKRPDEVKYAIEHDERAVFHTEPTEETLEIPYLRKFLGYVNNIIDHNKYDVFRYLLNLPVETVDFTEGVFNELKKIFNASDRFKKHEFTNPELAADYDDYLDLIGNEDFWKYKGFEAMKSAINSILIVDLPALANVADLRPQPYYYLLPLTHMIDIRVSDDMRVEYIIFNDMRVPDIVHVFDDLFYRSYSTKESIVLVTENMHDLGYTPARSFWSTPFNSQRKIQKKGPISNALGRLDWLLVEYVFAKHEALYAGFPVDIMYEQQCNYHDDDGNACENGYITKSVGTHLSGDPLRTEEQEIVPCPACDGNKPVLGPGTIITAPARADSEDPDLIQGLNRVSADVDSLNWIKDKIDSDELKITWNMIGYVQNQSKEAMNEMQVMGNLQSRETVILDVKSNFERAETFVVETMARLRYGAAYLGSVIFYGEKFYFQSVESIRTGIQDSKDAGLPQFEIISQQKQLLNTKYQNNPDMLERVKILMAIEPYQGYSLDDLIRLDQRYPLDPMRVLIKTNFHEYIARFEREFTNIVNFMPFSDFRERVEFIQTIIESYAEQDRAAAADTSGRAGGTQAPAGLRAGANEGAEPAP